MSELDDARDELDAAGAVAGIRWAHASAYDRVAEDYDPTTGHDQGWVGYNGYKLLVDRMDRVFSCGVFELADDADPGAGQDVLALGITPQQFESMPTVAPGVVVRDDLNGSPGWRCGSWRWLLASFIYGESDEIPWGVKSFTKRVVASVPSPDALMMFSDAELGIEFSGVPEEQDEQEEDGVPLRTLVLAHAMDGSTAERELYIGRSRYTEVAKKGWHWKLDLLSGPFGPGGGDEQPVQPDGPTGPDTVEDAPVSLRRQPVRPEADAGTSTE